MINRDVRRTSLLILLGSVLLNPMMVRADTSENGAASTKVSAVLSWADVTRLSSPVSGVVASVPVQAGQVVEQGALLLRLDKAPFADRLAVVTAERAGLVRAAAEAKRDAERAQALFDRTVASVSERQDALIKQEQSQAQLNAAKARVDLRQWELAQSGLVAPFPARILSVDTAVGETVSSALHAPVLLRIARADVMNAQANIAPSLAAGIHLGQTLTVHVNQSQVTGRVVSIASEPSLQGDGQAENYRLQVQFKPEQGWLAGLPAEITVP